MGKIKEYLMERKSTKADFYIYVQNAISKAIEEWEKKNKWESGEEKNEFYSELADGLIDFAKGMKKSIK